jgi:hypothetical protein
MNTDSLCPINLLYLPTKQTLGPEVHSVTQKDFTEDEIIKMFGLYVTLKG